MRNYNEFKPRLSEEYAYKFSIIQSLKNNILAWVGFFVIIAAIMAYAIALPNIKLNKAKDNYAQIEVQNKALINHIDKEVNEFNSLLTAFKYDENHINRLIFPLIDAKNSLSMVAMNEVLKRHEMLLSNENKLSDNPIFPDTFTVANRAVNVANENSIKVAKYFATNQPRIDEIKEYLKKAKDILNETPEEEKYQVYQHLHRNMKPLPDYQFGESFDIESDQYAQLFFKTPINETKKSNSKSEKVIDAAKFLSDLINSDYED